MTFEDQLRDHRVNMDVHREMRADRAALLLEIEALLKAAEADYQSAAAMHSMGKVSEAGGRIAAFKQVLKLI